MKNAGLKSAFKTFRMAAKEVPAYKEFLRKKGLSMGHIKEQHFYRLPIATKKNYLARFPLRDLFPWRQVPPMVYASSGSSGKPTFWFRGDAQEEIGGKLHEVIFRDIFHIKKKESTLVVICFSMGVWIAGGYTAASARWVSRRGYHLSVVTPGIEREDILNIFRNLLPHFDNLIIAGYPPFLMDVIYAARAQKIKFKNKKIRVLTAGDRITEAWRNKILELLGLKDPYRSVIDVYGSADAAILGHETPLTIFLRRESLKNKELCRSLFGDAPTLPSFVQYHPDYVFFEKIGDELVLTAKTASPLVRYNIHDVGDIFSHREVVAILERLGLRKKASALGLSRWKLPFVAVKGRTDVAVTFYALNIYPENIKAAIGDKKVAKFFSGNFITYNRTVANQRIQKLYIELELADGVRASRIIEKKTLESILENFIKLNIEFRKLYSVLGNKALPNVRLLPYSSPRFSSGNAKGLLGIVGKKPRMVL